MRISTDQKYANLQAGIQKAEGKVAAAQRKLASGRRLEVPSDDPFAAVGVLAFRSARAVANQQRRNAEAGKAGVSLAENAFAEIGEILKTVNKMVLQGANSTTDQEARRVMALEIRRLKERLVSVANTTDSSGRYLFAGHLVETKPFVPNPGAGAPILYQGDSGRQFLDVGPGTVLEGNFLIDQFVLGAYAALEDAENRLEGGDASGLSGVSLQLVRESTERLRSLRGEAGARINLFDASAASALRRSDEFTAQISSREDADLVEVVADLQIAQAAYQAALAAFSSATGMTLLDYLRR